MKRSVGQIAVSKIAIYILIVSQFLDGFFTYEVVKTLGLKYEANPIVRNLMEEIGIGPGLAITKLLAIILAIALFALQSEVKTRFFTQLLVISAAIYTIVVAGGAYIYLTM